MAKRKLLVFIQLTTIHKDDIESGEINSLREEDLFEGTKCDSQARVVRQ